MYFAIDTLNQWNKPKIYATLCDMADVMSASEVGERLRKIRLAKGFTQQAPFCDLVGISTQSWNNYERGRQLIPPDKAGKVSAATNATFDYIYRGITGSLPSDLATAIRKIERGR